MSGDPPGTAPTAPTAPAAPTTPAPLAPLAPPAPPALWAAGLVRLRVNGEPRSGAAEPRTLLSDFLRHELGLTGTHVGCEQGACGSCTVLVDGELTLSCLALAVQADGKEVETVEGIADGSRLHPLQQAFQLKHGLQCGFCTPGMLIAARALLAASPDPSEQEIREHLSGNVCRCTGYTGIVEAVLEAARLLREHGEPGT